MDTEDRKSVGLSQRERMALCNDISRFSLLLGQETGNAEEEKIGAAPGSPADSSPWERLHLLAYLWPRLEAALHAIAASPDSVALSEPRSLPIHAVRGHPATLARLARHPADHRAWAETDRHTAPDTPPRVQESRATHTVQTLPNRIAFGFLEALAQETTALHRLAHFCDEQNAAATADRLTRSVRHWLQQTPFQDCAASMPRGQALSPEPLQRCSPAYRSLYASIRLFRSGLHVDWSESAVLRFPVLEGWHLFEIWCFLRVGVALRALGWQPVENDCLQIVQAGLRLRLAHGKASRMRFHAPGRTHDLPSPDADLELRYQPLFASANQKSARSSSGFRSLSHVMQPDIALIRHGRLLLLDPKYRSYGQMGAEQEDIDKMHAYRDAIVRIEADGERPVPAVDAAWCLFPGQPVSSHAHPEPLRAYPAPTPAQPFGTAGIGAVQVRPGAENTELVALLQHWLQS